MILIAVGIQRGIAVDPNPIRVSFGVLALAAISFLIAVSFCFALVERRSSLLERTQEFAILKMLGASSAYMVRLLAQETFLIVIPGIISGISIASFSKWIIANFLAHFIFQANVYAWWPIAGAISAISDFLAASVTLWSFSRRDLVDALSTDD